MAYTSAERRANVRSQLRDKKGRWIEMGRNGKWYSSRDKKMLSGKVVDTKGNNAVMEVDNPDGTKSNIEVPSGNLQMINEKARISSKPTRTSNSPSKASLPSDYSKKVNRDGLKGVNRPAINGSEDKLTAADYGQTNAFPSTVLSGFNPSNTTPDQRIEGDDTNVSELPTDTLISPITNGASNAFGGFIKTGDDQWETHFNGQLAKTLGRPSETKADSDFADQKLAVWKPESNLVRKINTDDALYNPSSSVLESVREGTIFDDMTDSGKYIARAKSGYDAFNDDGERIGNISSMELSKLKYNWELMEPADDAEADPTEDSDTDAPEAPVEDTPEAPTDTDTPVEDSAPDFTPETFEDGFFTRESEDEPGMIDVVAPDGVVSSRVATDAPNRDEQIQTRLNQQYGARESYASRQRAEENRNAKEAALDALEPFEPGTRELSRAGFITADKIEAGDRLLTAPNGMPIVRTEESVDNGREQDFSGESVKIDSVRNILGQNKTSKGKVVGKEVTYTDKNGNEKTEDIYANRGGISVRSGVIKDGSEFREAQGLSETEDSTAEEDSQIKDESPTTDTEEISTPDTEPVEEEDVDPFASHPEVTRRKPETLEGEKYPPTQQQQDIIDAVLAGLDTKIQAKAGTGKTSTIEALARRLQKDQPGKRALYVAFNKSVQSEANKRMPENVESRTGHSIAYKWAPDWMTDRATGASSKDALRNSADIAAHLGVKDTLRSIDDNPLGAADQAKAAMDIVNKYANSSDDNISDQHLSEDLQELSDEDKDSLLDSADRIWKDINDKNGNVKVSFDHIRKAWALTKPDFSTEGTGAGRADIVLIDEAQDTPPVLGKVIADQNIQKVVVGDSDQQIYSFTGAIDYLNNAEADISLPLNKSWRFGPEVADIANRFLQLGGSRERVIGGGPSSQIVDQVDNPDGILVRTNAGMFEQIIEEQQTGRIVGVPRGTKGDLTTLINHASALAGGRKPFQLHEDLAPFKSWDDFVSAAAKGDNPKLSMIKGIFDTHGMQGLRDILENVVEEREGGDASGLQRQQTSQGTSLVGKGSFQHKDTLKAAGFRWLDTGKTISRGKNKGKPEKAWTATGTPEQQEATIAKVISLIENPVKPDVTVSTAHKAKGLEWNKVRIGSDFKGPEQDEETGEWTYPDPEELRLAYVAVTRAEKELDPGSLGYIFGHSEENGGLLEAPEPEKSDLRARAKQKMDELERIEHTQDVEEDLGNISTSPDEGEDVEDYIPVDDLPQEDKIDILNEESEADVTPSVSEPDVVDVTPERVVSERLVDPSIEDLNDLPVGTRMTSDDYDSEIEKVDNNAWTLNGGDQEYTPEDILEQFDNDSWTVELPDSSDDTTPEAPTDDDTTPDVAPTLDTDNGNTPDVDEPFTPGTPEYNDNGLTPEEQSQVDALNRLIDRAETNGKFEQIGGYEAEKDRILGQGRERLDSGEAATPDAVPEPSTDIDDIQDSSVPESDSTPTATPEHPVYTENGPGRTPDYDASLEAFKEFAESMKDGDFEPTINFRMSDDGRTQGYTADEIEYIFNRHRDGVGGFMSQYKTEGIFDKMEEFRRWKDVESVDTPSPTVSDPDTSTSDIENETDQEYSARTKNPLKDPDRAQYQPEKFLPKETDYSDADFVTKNFMGEDVSKLPIGTVVKDSDEESSNFGEQYVKLGDGQWIDPSDKIINDNTMMEYGEYEVSIYLPNNQNNGVDADALEKLQNRYLPKEPLASDTAKKSSMEDWSNSLEDITDAISTDEANNAGNRITAGIQKLNGMDGNPSVVTDREIFDNLPGKKVFRGVSSKEQADRFMSGPNWVGEGGSGSGIYTSTNKFRGQTFKSADDGYLLEMVIPEDAIIADGETLEKERQRDLNKAIAENNVPGQFLAEGDMGRYATARGYDGYSLEPSDPFEEGEEFIVLTNRGAASVFGEPIESNDATQESEPEVEAPEVDEPDVSVEPSTTPDSSPVDVPTPVDDSIGEAPEPQIPDTAPDAPTSISSSDDIVDPYGIAKLPENASPEEVAAFKEFVDHVLDNNGKLNGSKKVTSTPNGDEIRNGTLVTHPKFGPGFVTATLPSVESARIMYSDGKIRTANAKLLNVRGNTVPMPEPLDTDGMSVGDIGIDPTNGKLFLTDKNNNPFQIGDTVSYTKKGTTTEGKVTAIYKNSKQARIQFPDGKSKMIQSNILETMISIRNNAYIQPADYNTSLASQKASVMSRLRSMGITQINGIAIEDFTVARNKMIPPADSDSPIVVVPMFDTEAAIDNRSDTIS